ncbi:MAG: peptidoglycan-binding protein [Tildeniella torsiva UHER 1998/13D]|jgi:peptidoglycan hydrolase-like protein with peptidoglycan-binding domain|nr:peptidoglycan-binding protein [Tildeniella torsiva UHER 1998/13D]
MAYEHMQLTLNDGITNIQAALISEVKILQKTLKDWGVLATNEPMDGQFGQKTEAAVKLFQSKRGLEIDGVVGQQTWAELLKVEPFEVTIIPRPQPANGKGGPITKQQKAFLDMIAVPEGTSASNGYRVMFTGNYLTMVLSIIPAKYIQRTVSLLMLPDGISFLRKPGICASRLLTCQTFPPKAKIGQLSI